MRDEEGGHGDPAWLAQPAVTRLLAGLTATSRFPRRATAPSALPVPTTSPPASPKSATSPPAFSEGRRTKEEGGMACGRTSPGKSSPAPSGSRRTIRRNGCWRPNLENSHPASRKPSGRSRQDSESKKSCRRALFSIGADDLRLASDFGGSKVKCIVGADKNRWRLRKALREDASEFILQWCAFRDHLQPAKDDVVNELLVARIATSGRQHLFSLTPVEGSAGLMFPDESCHELRRARCQCQKRTRIRLGDVELYIAGRMYPSNSLSSVPPAGRP